MKDQPTAMHVARIRSMHTGKDGQQREYESRLLRRTYRDGDKVRHETIAKLSAMPDSIVDAVEAALKGEVLVPAGEAAVTVARSVPHGHVAAAWAMARRLGLPALLGPAGPERDLALGLILSRAVHPGSKLSTIAWWADVTLGADLGIEHATTDDAYAAMDWLQGRQELIEKKLARRHLAPDANPSRMALFDLSSSWLEGSHCPLGSRGYSRDGKKGKVQIEYGLLTDPEGRPVAIRVFEGNTGDPTAFTAIAGVVKSTFGLQKMVMVGDRGMITSARIEALKTLDEDYAWITALRAPAIRKLMADDGPLQLSLFDEQDLAEITSEEDFPGERLIACRNPALAEERARKREALLAATEKLLAPVIARVAAGRLAGQAEIGRKTGEVIGKYKMAKHFEVTITGTSLAIERKQEAIADEARLDGIYVIRTPLPAAELDAAGTVTAYKNLKYVERDFRHIKSDDLDLRPVFHRLEKRVKGHVLICMLAAYLTWHLRQAWAPLTYTDEEPPAPADPVAPANRSASAEAKARRQHDEHGRPYLSYQGLLDHLATLARNELRFHGTPATVPVLTDPTSRQQEAFDLIGAAIPLTLKK
ncbi:MAG: IS1634 family transposase [Streptosporangiaceae bacterium]